MPGSKSAVIGLAHHSPDRAWVPLTAGAAPTAEAGAGLAALSFSMLNVLTVAEPGRCPRLAGVSGSKGGQCSITKLRSDLKDLARVSIQK